MVGKGAAGAEEMGAPGKKPDVTWDKMSAAGASADPCDP